MDEKKLSRLEDCQRALLDLATRARLPANVLIEKSNLLGLSVRTLQRRLKRFRATGDPLTLSELQRGRSVGTRVLAPAVERIIEEAIERYYARKQKTSLNAVYRNIVLVCRHRGIRSPSLNTVIARVRSANQMELTRRREGVDKTRSLKPITGKQPPAAYPLHIVQMDHTLADIILVDREHHRPIGRLHLRRKLRR